MPIVSSSDYIRPGSSRRQVQSREIQASWHPQTFPVGMVRAETESKWRGCIAMTLNETISALRSQSELNANEVVRWQCGILTDNLRRWRKNPDDFLREQIRKNVAECEKLLRGE
jgi:hypothetical protein